MRLRNWLLTSTSIAAMLLLPSIAQAQEAEFRALLKAQQSGDADAISAAEQAFRDACAAAGLDSMDACMAAVQGGGGDKAAPAEEPQAEAPAPADQPAAEEAAPADQPAAEQPAPEPTKKKRAKPAAQEAPAEQPAPEPQATEPAPQDQPAAQPQAEQQQPAAEQPQLKGKAKQRIEAALAQYNEAVAEATSGGDYEAAKAKADKARSRLESLCADAGFADIVACTGSELTPFPPAPAAEPAPAPAEKPAPAPAEQPAPAPQAAPADQPAPTDATPQPAPAEQPAPPADGVAPADPNQPAPPAAEQPAQPNPEQAAVDQLQKAAQVYQVGIDQLDAGDPAGQSTIDAANAQFAQLCASLGINDVAQCLAKYGIELPPVPAAPAQPKPSDAKPISELPGADNSVAPETTEVLPESVKAGEAAPILDSAKDVKDGTEDPGQPAADGGNAQQPAQPAQPAAPPPETDKAAQADIAPVEVQSITQLQGEKFDAKAQPTVEVPQNVTIINNVTNVNVVNNTTVNNTTNNNAPGTPPKPPRPPRDNEPNYTNSGFIFQIGVNLVFSNPASDFDRISDDDEDFVYYERLSNGRVKETVERPNGVQIVTIRNKYGEVLKRSRITPDGREYILAYYDDSSRNDDDFFNWRDPGDDLPPLRLTIPVRDYILDADVADEDQVELFFRKPPVEQVKKIYSIDDVKRSARLRDSVRRIEVGGLTFDTGKATIARDQIGALSKVANAMLALLKDNPAETFLIEGHTDAVGSDQANLVLSDARAATVAKILTDFYDVPPENLTTQGYGERYLKVQTEGPEELNRRVSIKRITPLITVSQNQ